MIVVNEDGTCSAQRACNLMHFIDRAGMSCEGTSRKPLGGGAISCTGHGKVALVATIAEKVMGHIASHRHSGLGGKRSPEPPECTGRRSSAEARRISSAQRAYKSCTYLIDRAGMRREGTSRKRTRVTRTLKATKNSIQSGQ